jgi:tetratricopeptide (TPR) repeat protein
MALSEQDWKHREAAAGYCQLGMWHDADAELDEINPEHSAHSVVLVVRVEIYRGLQKWGLMREVSKRLFEFDPDDVQWRIALAFATRRAVSIEAAKEILCEAVRKFPKEAVIFFNLACYACQLGDLEASKNYLRGALAIAMARGGAGGRGPGTALGIAARGLTQSKKCESRVFLLSAGLKFVSSRQVIIPSVAPPHPSTPPNLNYDPDYPTALDRLHRDGRRAFCRGTCCD